MGRLAEDAGAPTAIGDRGTSSPVDAAIADGGSTPSVDSGFTVAKVAELALWLDGDQGISTATDGGLRWVDQSSHGNNQKEMLEWQHLRPNA